MDNQNFESIAALEPEIEENPFESEVIGSITLYRIIINAVKKLGSKPAVILWSSLVLLFFWGVKGNPALIFPEAWRMGLFPHLVWRDQLVSFITGFILMVVVPCGIIKFHFKESLARYGLSWTKKNLKPGLVALFILLVGSLPLFYSGTSNPYIQKEYPLFGTFQSGHPLEGQFKIRTWEEFIIYELIYILFFISIEFIFRGYLLFGLHTVKKRKPVEQTSSTAEPLMSGGFAILVQMLIYTTWHLPKPHIEYIGAFFWGAAVTYTALKIRSIWPIIISHWLLNVFMDTVLWLR